VKRTFEVLTTIVSVAIDDALPILDLARMVLDGYPDSKHAPELAFELRAGARPTLACLGEYETPVEDPIDLVALLELDMYHAVAERAAPGWLLHAAALERDGRAIVLAGPSGAGKTTLTLALVARGWRIATEEMVLIDRALAVRGLARPIHAPVGGPQHALLPASWPQLEYPLRGAPAERGVIAQPVPDHRVTGPLPLGALVRIDHAPGVSARGRHRLEARAISQLWPCTLRQDDAGLALATELVVACQPSELWSATVDDAVHLLVGLQDH
jgi:hypothetical protein